MPARRKRGVEVGMEVYRKKDKAVEVEIEVEVE